MLAGVELGRVRLRVDEANTVHEVQENGTERLRLRASGAVPATSTHGTAAPPQAPTRHTHQAAHQAAAAAALVYTRQVRRDTGSRVIITLSNSTTHRNLIERGEPVGPPTGPESRGQQAQRAAANGARDRKRRREEKGGADAHREATQLTQNKNQLRSMECNAPGMVQPRAPQEGDGSDFPQKWGLYSPKGIMQYLAVF